MTRKSEQMAPQLDAEGKAALLKDMGDRCRQIATRTTAAEEAEQTATKKEATT